VYVVDTATRHVVVVYVVVKPMRARFWSGVFRSHYSATPDEKHHQRCRRAGQKNHGDDDDVRVVGAAQ
jgi:hypothetical protein